MTDKIKSNLYKCEPCRSINISECSSPASHHCHPTEPCWPGQPVQPTCIKVLSNEEYRLSTLGTWTEKQFKCPAPPYYAHGKVMWLVKSAILVGTAYFTYHQNIWGNQEDVDETHRRWMEYFKSLSSRRPPAFDKCGKVIVSDNYEGAGPLAPFYDLYKEFVTTCFSGIVKFPRLLKCAYVDYLEQLRLKQVEEAKERSLR